MLSDEVIADLLEKDLITTESDPATELERQRRTLIRLEKRCATGGAAARYLAQYDALMRHTEIHLLGRGYRFGDRPHLGLRTMARRLQISSSDIDGVVAARHAVKKNNAVPSATELQNLTKISVKVRAALLCGWLPRDDPGAAPADHPAGGEPDRSANQT